MYILRRKQYFKASLEETWAFLKNPFNLNHITPPELNFEIVSKVPEEMFNGMIIEYSIRIPRIGKQKWITEIKHIRQNHSFVDEQRIGPYTFWYHYHELKSQTSGVISFDTVYYLPPFGVFGKVLHALYIKKQLHKIFDFRRDKLAEILG